MAWSKSETNAKNNDHFQNLNRYESFYIPLHEGSAMHYTALLALHGAAQNEEIQSYS